MHILVFQKIEIKVESIQNSFRKAGISLKKDGSEDKN